MTIGNGAGGPGAYGPQPPKDPYGDYGSRTGWAPAAQPRYPGLVLEERESEKSFVVTWLLAWFLGGFGIDRFYLGKTSSAVLKLVTLGGCGVWALVDLILVLAGAQKDRYGRTLRGYRRHRVMAWVVTGVVTVVGLIGQAASGDADDDDDIFGPASRGAVEVVVPQPGPVAAAGGALGSRL